MALDVSIVSWKKSHPANASGRRRGEDHPVEIEGDADSIANRTKALLDYAQMMRSLGKTHLAQRANEAAERLRNPRIGAPREAGRRKYEGSDAYACAMRRKEKTNACSET
jgi:hypothetical protein